jgi:hypothetical protein
MVPPSLQFVPLSIRNNLSHERLSQKALRMMPRPCKENPSDGIPKSLPISYNESLSNDGAPPLLETPNWCALSLSAQETDVESSCN